MKLLIYTTLLLSFILASCSTYNDQEISNFDKEIKEFISKNDLKYKKSTSGLYYNIIKEGEGDNIQITDSVVFTYEGKLLSGEIFDKQRKPITFQVKDLIQGWKEIIIKSKPGTEVELIIPPHLGYGAHDLDDIPPNSILLFKMNIISIL